MLSPGARTASSERGVALVNEPSGLGGSTRDRRVARGSAENSKGSRLRERDRTRCASLDARGRRAAGRRRDLHLRLRLSAPRVLPSAALDRHAHVPSPPSRARRRVRASRRRRHHRACRFHGARRRRGGRRARSPRLCRAGAVSGELRHHAMCLAKRTWRTRCTTRRSPRKRRSCFHPPRWASSSRCSRWDAESSRRFWDFHTVIVHIAFSSFS